MRRLQLNEAQPRDPSIEEQLSKVVGDRVEHARFNQSNAASLLEKVSGLGTSYD
jgi:hypothetical protein